MCDTFEHISLFFFEEINTYAQANLFQKYHRKCMSPSNTAYTHHRTFIKFINCKEKKKPQKSLIFQCHHIFVGIFFQFFIFSWVLIEYMLRSIFFIIFNWLVILIRRSKDKSHKLISKWQFHMENIRKYLSVCDLI